MDKKVRILYVNGGVMDRGGVSSVMMNYYLRFDPQILQIDFLVHGDIVGERDQEIINHGGKIYRVPPKSRNPIVNYTRIKKIMKDGKYDIVHAHADTGNSYILKIANDCGVRVRISHCHNTGFTIKNKFRIAINNIQKRLISKYATHKWACSEAAGRWLYGNNAKFEVIPNAIDVRKFEYDPILRKKLRAEYGLSDKTVVGHIGRFDYQKNQSFLLDAFADALRKDASLMLVLVGDGIDRQKLEKRIQTLALQNNVCLLGERSDVYEIINMFDIFAFPSRFEGLGVVVIEAQANGLSCVCSSTVPKETNITGNVEFLPLEISAWSQSIRNIKDRDWSCINKIIMSGYEINKAAQILQERYIEMVN